MILISILSIFLALMAKSSSPSYGTHLSQLIRFARVCNKVEDFNDRNSIIFRKLLKHDFFSIIKLGRHLPNFITFCHGALKLDISTLFTTFLYLNISSIYIKNLSNQLCYKILLKLCLNPSRWDRTPHNIILRC